MIDTLLCRSISSYKLPVSCQVVNGAQEAPENCTGKNPVQSCLDTFGTTLCGKNTLCNVVQVAPDNTVNEKIVFSVFAILALQR